MSGRNRRKFLADVGRGMLVASVGSATALDLGLSAAWADDADQRVTFGNLEPLVSLMQETAPDKLSFSWRHIVIGVAQSHSLY